MTALSTPQKIHTQLSTYATTQTPIPHPAIAPILQQLTTLTSALHNLDKAIQTTGDVNDALALILQMLDAAYDRKLEADSLRCLIEPLAEKLSKAVDEMRWAL